MGSKSREFFFTLVLFPFIQLSMNVSIIFRLLYETAAIVCYVFLWNFAREISARAAKIKRMTYLRLTAVLRCCWFMGWHAKLRNTR